MLRTAGTEQGPCSIEKIVSVNSVVNYAPVDVMGLEQQPEHGLCYLKPCFAC